MTKDDFIFNLKRCGFLYKDGHTYYEENELIECFEDVGAFNPKTGHREYNDIYDHYLCGNCKTVVMDYDNYCPNCGARMESEDEE